MKKIIGQSKSRIFFPIIIGVIFLGIGFWIFSLNWHLLKRGAETQGTVVDIVEGRSGRARIRSSYAPIIEFSTPDGEIHRAQSRFSTGFLPTLKDRMTILYNPNDPTNIVEKNPLMLYAFPGAFALAGILLIGVPLYWTRRKS
ncbi:MAG: hypothetical protein RL141_293 [Candidatus Parcubacteria bacterium]|jgi:hypothetical protein